MLLGVWHCLLQSVSGAFLIWTSIIQASPLSVQLKLVSWLDNNDKPKEVAIYFLVGLFTLFIITTTLLLGDNTFFYSPGEGPQMYCDDFIVCLQTAQH